MKNFRQVTLEFRTKAERDLWMRWYRNSGSTHFFCRLSNPKSKKWRKVAEARMDKWPKYNERFV